LFDLDDSHGVNLYKQDVMILPTQLLEWIHPVTKIRIINNNASVGI